MIRKLFLGAVLLIGAGSVGVTLFSWQQTRTNAAAAADFFTSEDRYVEVDGLDVRVRIEGPENAPTLLMLHGFTFSLESYDELAAQLDDTFRVIRYDMRGHGLTGPDPEKRYSPEQRAAHVGAVLDALGVEAAAIMGNSLGGLAAWRYAASVPDRVDALILVSPGAYPINGVTDEPAPVPAALAAYFRLLPEAGIDASIERIYADASRISDERKATIKAMMRAPGNGAAFIDAVEVFTLPDPEPALSGLDVPTLIIWGDDDVVIDPAHGRKMRSVMPQAELLMLAGVGHAAHEEVPERVAREVRRFLGEPRNES